MLEAHFPAVDQEARWLMPGHGQQASQTGGKLELGRFVEAISNRREDLALAIVFVGGRGLGTTPTLHALVARVKAELDVLVHEWPAAPAEPNPILVRDDLDRLPALERRRLMEAVRKTNGTLISTSSVEDPLADLPHEKVVVQLQPGQSWWAVQYLEHLEAMLAKRSHAVELQTLRDWLEDDPYTSALAGRIDTLGILARHVVDGGTVPTRHADVLRLSLERWERLLRQRGHGPTALTLRLLWTAGTWRGGACGTDARRSRRLRGARALSRVRASRGGHVREQDGALEQSWTTGDAHCRRPV